VPSSTANIAGCAAVLAAVGALSFGLPAVNRAISSERLISASAPYGVGLGVDVTPPTHTVIDASGTTPSANVVLFVRNGVEYRVRATPYSGSLVPFAAALRSEVRHFRGAQALDANKPVSTARGVAGYVARFEESDSGGILAAFVDHGVAVAVLITGSDQGLVENERDILRSVTSLRFASRG
jgi:hypothetical protein